MTHETTHDATPASDKGVSNDELTDAIEELEYRLCRLEYELGIEEEGDGVGVEGWPESLHPAFAPYDRIDVGHRLDFWVDRQGDLHITNQGEQVGTHLGQKDIDAILAEMEARR